MYAGLLNDCPLASTNNMLILHKNFLKLNIKASTYTKNLRLKEWILEIWNLYNLPDALRPGPNLPAWTEISVKVVMNYYQHLVFHKRRTWVEYTANRTKILETSF